jgi:glucan phosphoethanolaminetransferase (alkaline phosphatase superfamily)
MLAGPACVSSLLRISQPLRASAAWRGLSYIVAQGSSTPPFSAEQVGPASVEAARPRLQRLARRRRKAAWALLVAVPLLVVLLDFRRRGGRIAQFEQLYALTYLASFVESLCVWGSLLYAAARRRGVLRHVAGVLFVTMVTFSVGGQSYFYDQYHAYLNVDVSVFASNFMDSVVNQLLADFKNYLAAKLPPLLLSLLLVWLARRVVRPTRLASRLVGPLSFMILVGSFFIPTQHRSEQASTPDTLYLHAVGGLLRTQFGFTDQSNQQRPRARNSLPLPPLTRASVPKRNVLFVILESVRADATCIEHDPACKRTQATNQLFPGRFPFTQMRSMDSCTAISLAVLWSGVRPIESRDTLHEWPLIFDYAKKLGYDTAYWTSQNMMFGNVRLWVKNLGVSQMVTATDLDPTSDLDMGAPEKYLADHVSQNIGSLKEPFMAVVQLSNVHYPYYLDPTLPTPFQPWTTSKAAEDNAHFKNFYQNAVYQQDLHVARMLAALRASPAGKNTVIVYTSDHAEAFREHGQMGHTFSIFDEEVHVPAWIDAPPGTLTDAEQQSLRDKRREFLFHVDIAPTVLDLIGVPDDPALAKYRVKMPGHSLLRPELTSEPLPLSNCAGVWSCAFENWGIMQGSRKLEARSWDTGWNCYDVADDPLEQARLPLEHCDDLLKLAEQTYGRLPGKDVPKPD